MDNKICNVNTADEKNTECILYRRRWAMLFIFIGFSLMNAFQWVQYSIIADVVMEYYNVESVAVDWTSMIYMITYVVLIIPASHFIDKKGLRWCLILGNLLALVGSCIKIFSIGRDLFWVTFIGQTLVAITTVFVISVPACLAAEWFGEKEVSTACSIGILGNDVGVALGFYIPTMIVKKHKDLDETGSELRMLFYGNAAVSAVFFVLTIFFFQEKPPSPPSPQQAHLATEGNLSQNQDSTWTTVKRLLLNKNYVLLLLVYSFNQGVFTSLSTLLNQIVLSYFKDGEELAGRLGVLFIISGMLAGVVFGIILDRTHQFRVVTLGIFVMSLVAMAGFTVSLEMQSEPAVYVTAAFLGAFLLGYMPVAYDFGAELTYPEPEGMASGLLTLPTQLFGTFFTLGFGPMITHVGATWTNVAQCASLLIGVLIHLNIKSDLRRQAVTANKDNLQT